MAVRVRITSISLMFLLLCSALLATTLQGVQGEVEVEGPSESECRPYIEKALKKLETGDTQSADVQDDDITHIVTTDDSDTQGGEAIESIEKTSVEDGTQEVENEQEVDTGEIESVEVETATEEVADETGDTKEESVEEKTETEEVGSEQTDAPSEEKEGETEEGTESAEKEASVEGEEEASHEKEEGTEEQKSGEEGAEPSVEDGTVSTEETTTSAEEATASTENEEGVASVEQEDDAASVEQDDKPSVEEETATSTEEAAASTEQEEGATSIEEQEASAEEVATSAEQEEGTASIEQEEEAQSTEQEEADIAEEGAASVEEDVATSAEQEEGVASVEEGAASVEEGAASVEEGAASVEEEGAASAEETATSAEETATSAEDTAASAEESATSVEQESEVGSVEQEIEAANEEQEAEAASVEQEAEVASTEQNEADSNVEQENNASAEQESAISVEQESATSVEDATASAEQEKDTAASTEQEGETVSAEVEKEASEEGDLEKEGSVEQADEADSQKEENIEGEQEESVEKDNETKEVSGETETEVDTESKQDSSEKSEEEVASKEGEEEAEVESTPEEDLTWEVEIPSELRPRDHINEILNLNEEPSETDSLILKAADKTLNELKKIYENAIKPLETLYKYRDLSNRHFGDPEIFSKPLVLFMGPWSGGKSSIVNYLLDNEYTPTALRTGAEPSPAYFNLVMWGEEPEVLDGTQLAADWTFSGLQKFGQGLEERLRGLKLPNKLLEKINVVEIPGILEVRKQVSRVFPFNDACQWFIDRADIIFLVYDPSKLDVGPETEAILDQLKGREYQTRIILNKADQVKPEELMRVQGALIWNISPLMSSAQPPVMYSTSLWSKPYEIGSPARLLHAQERAFLKDLKTAVDKRIENKIASARRFAVRVRNHAKMVDCYLTTYYNHKSVFGNKKLVSDQIIEHPQDYHIYEGLSTLTNISRYDLPDPDVYRDFFRLNPLYDFQQLSATCTYFRGCPINRLDVAIAYDLPELVGKYKKMIEPATNNNADSSTKS